MRPVRVLALSPVPQEGAGARFRIYQYIPALAAAGFRVTVSPFFTPDFFRIVYERGRLLQKSSLFARQTLARLRLLASRTNYDLFFVYREAFPIGPPVLEAALSATAARPLVYDFDDAIFLPNQSDANRLLGMLKYPRKTSQIIRRSAKVLAGNQYLADYARAYNSSVTVIPTCVDTSKFVPAPEGDGHHDRPIVGWIGSHSTARYLESLLPVLGRVAGEHRFHLYVVGSSRALQAGRLELSQAPWALEREVEDFQRCDIGLYPLEHDQWSRGKCGLKAIQFMACGVPVVATAVGANREIIEDGIDGFLATTENEWVEKIGWLLSDWRLREKLGQAGRRTVEERYALRVHAPRLISALQDVAGRQG